MDGIQQFYQDLWNLWGNPGLTERDPLSLVPLLETVHDQMPSETLAPLKEWINELHEDYMSGHIGPTFGQEVHGSLTVLCREMFNSPDAYNSFDNIYPTWVENQRNNPKVDPKDITIGETRDISAGIRKEADSANNWEQIDSILGGILEAAQNNPTYAASLGSFLPTLSTFRSNLQQTAMQNATVSMDKGKGENVHYIPKDMMNQARSVIHSASDLFEFNHMACKGFSEAYAAGKKAYTARAEMQRGRATLKVAQQQSDYVDSIEEKIWDIYHVQRKMHEERSFLHRDSEEYKNMKKAVDDLIIAANTIGFDFNINDTTKKTIDTTDSAVMNLLSGRFAEVYEAATKYAEKEAQKNKHTSMGIERKNTALVLKDLTKPDNVVLTGTDVKDMRINKKDKRVSVSFDQLMQEEKERNRKNYKTEHTILPEVRSTPKHTPKNPATGRIM